MKDSKSDRDFSELKNVFGDKLRRVSLSEIAKVPNPGLRSYMEKTWQGNSEVYTTPWIKSKDTSAILREADEILQAWMPRVEELAEKMPSLVEFERDLAAKVGPLSTQKPLLQRLDDIKAYYEGVTLPAVAIEEQAIKLVLMEYQQARGLTPRSEDHTLTVMKKSTSSGLPFFRRKRLVAEETLSSTIYVRDNVVFERFKDGSVYTIGAILGWRGQEGGLAEDDVKQRVVWMFPFKVNIAELCVYQPLIETFQRFKLMPAYVSNDEVDRQITLMFDSKAPEDLVICTDFTKFDQHFNEVMQNAALQILAGLLNKSPKAKDWLDNIFPIKYNITMCFALDGDSAYVLHGTHGMGSGSGGTNFDESLAHRALQYEAAAANGKALNPYSQCHGDDGVLTYPGITVEQVTRSYTAHGLEMNESKQYASAHDCVYLRRWHSDSYRKDGICVGVYSTARALGRLCFQERYMDPEDLPGSLDRTKMIALRELSIIENCKYHPLFEEFVDYCMKRDKFRLGLDIPRFFENLSRYAMIAHAFMPDFLGYNISLQNKQLDYGINDWAVVKYLKSKR